MVRKIKTDSNVEVKKKSKSSSNKRTKRKKIDKEDVIVQLVSQIPNDASEDRLKEGIPNATCGSDCEYFVPRYERGDDDRNHLCKGKDSSVIDRSTFCGCKKVHNELLIIPDWLDYGDEEEEDENEV